MDELREELEEFVQLIETTLSKFPEGDVDYFEGKKFAYETVIEMIKERQQ